MSNGSLTPPVQRTSLSPPLGSLHVWLTGTHSSGALSRGGCDGDRDDFPRNGQRGRRTGDGLGFPPELPPRRSRRDPGQGSDLEPPRVSWRLHSLRGWSDDETK